MLWCDHKTIGLKGGTLQFKGMCLRVTLTGGGIAMTNCPCQLELAEGPAAVREGD